MEFLRSIAHLPSNEQTIIRWQLLVSETKFCRSIHNFFPIAALVYIHSPIITASDCEGAASDVPSDHSGSRATSEKMTRAKSISNKTFSADRLI